MKSVIQKVNEQFMKSQVVDVHSGDTVKVHQKIREGGKERVQIFQGLVIKVSQKNSLMHRITVRRLASGVGVEKSFLMHSPMVLKIEVTKRSKVRRNYLTYMRDRTGKSARLSGVDFDREGVNTVHDAKAEEEEEKLREQTAASAEAEAAKKEKAEAEQEAKAEAALASRQKSDDEKEEPKE